jgi:hypothetical protein
MSDRPALRLRWSHTWPDEPADFVAHTFAFLAEIERDKP